MFHSCRSNSQTFLSLTFPRCQQDTVSAGLACLLLRHTTTNITDYWPTQHFRNCHFWIKFRGKNTSNTTTMEVKQRIRLCSHFLFSISIKVTNWQTESHSLMCTKLYTLLKAFSFVGLVFCSSWTQQSDGSCHQLSFACWDADDDE